MGYQPPPNPPLFLVDEYSPALSPFQTGFARQGPSSVVFHHQAGGQHQQQMMMNAYEQQQDEHEKGEDNNNNKEQQQQSLLINTLIQVFSPSQTSNGQPAISLIEARTMSEQHSPALIRTQQLSDGGDQQLRISGGILDRLNGQRRVVITRQLDTQSRTFVPAIAVSPSASPSEIAFVKAFAATNASKMTETELRAELNKELEQSMPLILEELEKARVQAAKGTANGNAAGAVLALPKVDRTGGGEGGGGKVDEEELEGLISEGLAELENEWTTAAAAATTTVMTMTGNNAGRSTTAEEVIGKGGGEERQMPGGERMEQTTVPTLLIFTRTQSNVGTELMRQTTTWNMGQSTAAETLASDQGSSTTEEGERHTTKGGVGGAENEATGTTMTTTVNGVEEWINERWTTTKQMEKMEESMAATMTMGNLEGTTWVDVPEQQSSSVGDGGEEGGIGSNTGAEGGETEQMRTTGMTSASTTTTSMLTEAMPAEQKQTTETETTTMTTMAMRTTMMGTATDNAEWEGGEGSSSSSTLMETAAATTTTMGMASSTMEATIPQTSNEASSSSSSTLATVENPVEEGEQLLAEAGWQRTDFADGHIWVRCQPFGLEAILRSLPANRRSFPGGVLFAKDFQDQENCFAKLHTTNSSSDGQEEAQLQIGTTECGQTSAESSNPPGQNHSVVLVFAPYRSLVLSTAEFSFLVQCFVPALPAQHQLSAELAIQSPIAAPVLIHTITLQQVPPRCEYSLRRDSPNGPLVESAGLGQTIFHRWECQGGQEATEQYGIFLSDCAVANVSAAVANASSDLQQNIELIDANGCSTDPLLLSTPEYATDRLLAFARANVFSLRPDAHHLRFSCRLTLCLRTTDGCKGLTPPMCSTNASSSTEALALSRRHSSAQFLDQPAALSQQLLSPELAIPSATKLFKSIINNTSTSTLPTSSMPFPPPRLPFVGLSTSAREQFFASRYSLLRSPWSIALILGSAILLGVVLGLLTFLVHNRHRRAQRARLVQWVLARPQSTSSVSKSGGNNNEEVEEAIGSNGTGYGGGGDIDGYGGSPASSYYEDVQQCEMPLEQQQRHIRGGGNNNPMITTATANHRNGNGMMMAGEQNFQMDGRRMCK